jgi:hypothetical protein
MKDNIEEDLPDLDLPLEKPPIPTTTKEQREIGLMEIKEYIPDPQLPAVPKLTQEMDSALHTLESELKELFEKIDPILSPVEDTASATREQLTGVSATSKKIAEWTNKSLELSVLVHDITARVEF